MLEDEGTMPEMVALAGIQGISIEEKKISNSFEKHDQLLMCMGHLYVTNMFLNYNQSQNPPKIITGTGAGG